MYLKKLTKYNNSHYFIYAGEEGEGDFNLWSLTQVNNSKYFKVTNKGKYNGHVSLIHDPK